MILHRIDYNDGCLFTSKSDINIGDMAIHNNDLYRSKYPDKNHITICNKSNHFSIQEHWDKIEAQSTNLSLPNIPYVEIEESVEDLAYEYYVSSPYHDIVSSYHWLNGYKAASAKEWSTQDVIDILNKYYTDEAPGDYIKRDIGRLLQLLQPKVVSIEVEMEEGEWHSKQTTYDQPDREWFVKYDCPKPTTYVKDGRTFLKVIKVNHESQLQIT